MMRLEFCLFFVRWCFAIVLLAVAALASLNLGVCIDIWMVMACLAVFLVDWRVTFLSARYRYHVIVKVFCIVLCVAVNRSYSDYHPVGKLFFMTPLLMLMLSNCGIFFKQGFVRMFVLMFKPIVYYLLLFLGQAFLLGLNESHMVFPFMCIVLLEFAPTMRMRVVALLLCLLSEMILLGPVVSPAMFSICRATSGVDIVCMGNVSFFDNPMSRLIMVPFVLIYSIMLIVALISRPFKTSSAAKIEL